MAAARPPRKRLRFIVARLLRSIGPAAAERRLAAGRRNLRARNMGVKMRRIPGGLSDVATGRNDLIDVGASLAQ
jgi:hypothetical protein